MAIDTEDKRRSTLRGVLPVPDSSIDAGDRAHLWVYRGIAIGNIVIVAGSFTVEAAGAYVAGAEAGGVTVAGSERAGAYVAGAEQGGTV